MTSDAAHPITSRERFWEAADLPVFCNVLCATREEALAVPRGDIRLAFDATSGLITNTAFDAGCMEYDVAYENSLHFSPRFQEYADALARRLIERHDLRGKTILEIACGQGDFLSTLCALGSNRGIGFDPAHDPADAAPGANVEFIRDCYGAKYADTHADFVCCRHALEHIPNPAEFLRGIRAALGDRTDTVVFFEVPNGLYTLRQLGIWDLIYEHCTYFVPDSLRWCFTQAGFDVREVREEYDGQFLTLTARPAAGDARTQTASNDLVHVARDIAGFSEAYDAKVAEWSQRIDGFRATGRRVVVWGSGSKGVTFLNIIKPARVVEHIVDINPRKQGKFVAGTGQAIVAPEFLRTHAPDAVIVMNAIYLAEIRATLVELGVDAEVLVA